MFHYDFRPRGVCSQYISIDLDDSGTLIEEVQFLGGCSGNLNAIRKLTKGMKVDDVVEILAGNKCGPRPTSCADQMTIGLREAQAAARA